MRLISLDKKLQIIQHRLTKQEMVNLAEQHKLEVSQIEEEFKKQMLIKFLPLIQKNLKMERTADDEFVTYNVRGYILSERQLYETLLEVMMLDENERDELTKIIQNFLGIYSQ